MASILLVEDDELVASLFGKVLQKAGHTLLTAYSGREALEVCRAAAGKLGMVITDVVMPDISGPEWVEMAGEDLDRIPVVYITGYCKDAREQYGLDVEESDLLTKPVRIADLLEAVEERL